MRVPPTAATQGALRGATSRLLASVIAAAGALAAVGCTGNITSSPLPGEPGGFDPTPDGQGSGGANSGTGSTGGSGAGGSGVVPGPFAPAPGRLRRLTDQQFRASLKDLLGESPALPIEADAWSDGLPSIAASKLAISPRGIEQVEAIVEAALDRVFGDSARRTALIGCAPGGAADANCARTFVTTFGRKAWRRALTTAEADRYVKLLLDNAAAFADFSEGARRATSAFLQSPYFVYRVEIGTPDPARPGAFRLSGDEIATRMSYLLWGTTPDTTLLDAAASRGLDDAAGIEREARRLLASPRAEEGLRNFLHELYNLPLVDGLQKDPALYPQLTAALRTGMRDEIVLAWKDAALTSETNLTSLLDSTKTYINRDLARLYGLPATVAPAGGAQVAATLPADGPRAGLLGMAGLLAVHSKQNETSPTDRGKFIRETFLCDEIPPPPPNVDTTLPEPPAGVVMTKRERFAIHRESPVCASCHALTDPTGLALEPFDALGIHRTTEYGKTIDASGELDGVAFADPRGLGRVLAASPAVRTCMVKQLYRLATGHRETDGEAIVIAALDQQFVGANGRYRDLLVAIAKSDGFRIVAPGP